MDKVGQEKNIHDSSIPAINESVSGVQNAAGATSAAIYNVEALTKLLNHTKDIVFNPYGIFGSSSQPCDHAQVLEYAKSQLYLMLDLKHVIRLYFSDDYFDLMIDTKDPFVKSDLFPPLLESVKKELKSNQDSSPNFNASDCW